MERKKREEGGKRKNRDEEHMKKRKKNRRKKRERDRERDRSPHGCDYEIVCHRLRLQDAGGDEPEPPTDTLASQAASLSLPEVIRASHPSMDVQNTHTSVREEGKGRRK